MSDLVKRYFRLPRRHIGYLRFILESYDGLAFVSTLQAQDGLIVITCPVSRFEDTDRLIGALAGELDMLELAAPDIEPDLLA